MNYVLLRVHSFACDVPRCSTEVEHLEYRMADAWKLAVKEGWTRHIIRGVMMHYCPAHPHGGH